MPDGLAALARQQLAGWDAIAESWPVSLEGGSSSDANTWRCGDCGGSVALSEDGMKRPYRYTAEQFRALVVIHLRNHHEDLDPN